MKPFIKWAGGKEQELPVIRKYLPEYSGRYIDPFVGGGAVYLDVQNNNYVINDKSTELISLYNAIKHQDSKFLTDVKNIYNEFRDIDTVIDNNTENILRYYTDIISIETLLKRLKIDVKYVDNEIFNNYLYKGLEAKRKRSNKLEIEQGSISNEDRISNIESAIKSAYYTTIRNMYNKKFNLAMFYFIREYCYSSMFRYNKQGEFNVPYGGISYNRKDFQRKLDYISSSELVSKLQNTDIHNKDFEEFIKDIQVTADDFLFLDPPYDSDFSTYAKNTFDKSEQERLCNLLCDIKAKWMLVIKNTDFIYGLYKDFNIESFDKKYLVSFKNRNDRNVKHLVVKNY